MKLPAYQNSGKFSENIENFDFNWILSKILILTEFYPKFWFLTEFYLKILIFDRINT